MAGGGGEVQKERGQLIVTTVWVVQGGHLGGHFERSQSVRKGHFGGHFYWGNMPEDTLGGFLGGQFVFYWCFE